MDIDTKDSNARLQVATPDRTPHSGIQAWSRGDLFPAVIAVVETYDKPATFEEWVSINSQLGCNAVASSLYAGYLSLFYDRRLADRVVDTWYRLTYNAYVNQFATREDAEGYARYLIDMDAANSRQRAIERCDAPRAKRVNLMDVWLQTTSTAPQVREVA